MKIVVRLLIVVKFRIRCLIVLVVDYFVFGSCVM